MSQRLGFKVIATLSAFMAVSCVNVSAGEKALNGGGGEVEFSAIKTEITSWMRDRLSDGTLDQKLDLVSAGITGTELYIKFVQALSDVGPSLSFQNEPLTLSGYSTSPAGRICANGTEPARIICSSPLWNAAPPQIKYAIVFHEYLGIAKIEVNQGQYSQYLISKNIVQYVRHTEKYELGFKVTTRSDEISEMEEQKKRLADLKNILESPAPEDLANYPTFANGGKDRGVARVLQSGYYSFVRSTHDYGYGVDIKLEGNGLWTGFAGLDYGFFANLGQIGLESVTTETPGVPFASQYQTPGGRCEGPAPSVRAEQEKVLWARDGFANVDGYVYKPAIVAEVGATYVLRAINYNQSDVLVAFQIVRQDPTDGSLILIWKLLKTYPLVNCKNPY